jgi:hypothetical protein
MNYLSMNYLKRLQAVISKEDPGYIITTERVFPNMHQQASNLRALDDRRKRTDETKKYETKVRKHLANEESTL